MTPKTIMCLAVAALAISGCGSSAAESSPAFRGADFGHVHGVGVNPSDGALFLASHNGLFRVAKGAGEAERVADRYQDTMGFAVIGPDRFIGSGHPDGRDKLPPFLGLIESRDAGRSWRPISLLGKADFHVLEAQGSRIYGFGSDFKSREPRFLRSSDAGRSWKRLSEPKGLVALAIEPQNHNSIIAAGASQLHISSDGGTTWAELTGSSGLLAWPESAGLLKFGEDGRVELSKNQGRSWEQRGELGGVPAAVEVAPDRSIIAALHDGTILRSTDTGNTWRAWTP